MALAGPTLYAVIDPGCLHRRAGKRLALVAVSLRTGVRRTLAIIAPRPVGLAAAGARVALSYAAPNQAPPRAVPVKARRAVPVKAPNAGTVTPVTVTVIGARRGRTLYRVTAPVRAVNGSLTTEIDAQGDVLVTSTFFIPPAPQSFGWWATTADPAGHELPELRTTGQVISSTARGPEVITGAAALSEGRIAYVSNGAQEGEQIDLLDVHSGGNRPVADFTGEARVVGLDLSASELAWAQENTVTEVSSGPVPGGGFYQRCRTMALGPVQLAGIEERQLPATPLLIGAPLPKSDQQRCIES